MQVCKTCRSLPHAISYSHKTAQTLSLCPVNPVWHRLQTCKDAKRVRCSLPFAAGLKFTRPSTTHAHPVCRLLGGGGGGGGGDRSPTFHVHFWPPGRKLCVVQIIHRAKRNPTQIYASLKQDSNFRLTRNDEEGIWTHEQATENSSILTG